MFDKYKKIGTTLGVISSLFLLSLAVFAFTGPSASAPGGNVSAPIDTSKITQLKEGSLTVSGLIESVSGVRPGHSSQTRPTCNADNRGKLFTVYASAGDSDRVYTCRYRGGSYLWEQIAWMPEAAQTINDGLVGHWTFNEGHGSTAYDYSTNTNHGTLHNPNWPQGPGYALDFNGTSNYVNAGNDVSLDITEEVTIVAWVTLNANAVGDDSWRAIVSKGKDEAYQLRKAGSVSPDSFRLNIITTEGSDSIDSNYKVEANKWIHVVATYSSVTGEMKLYVNGDIDKTETHSNGGLIEINSKNLRIGNRGDDSQYWDGKMDNVRIYNRALSAQEVEDLYNGKEVGSGLVGWWAMNEGTGGTVTDYSGNGNTGTIYGATWLDGRGPVFEENTTGYGIRFNGINNRGTVPTTGASKDTGTIAFWFNRIGSSYMFNTAGTSQRIYIGVRSDGDAYFTLGDPSRGIGTFSVDANRWYFVTGVWDNGTGSFYINGDFIRSRDYTPLTSVQSTMFIASFSSTPTFNGVIDDIRFYNRALRPEEIRYLYETTYRE